MSHPNSRPGSGGQIALPPPSSAASSEHKEEDNDKNKDPADHRNAHARRKLGSWPESIKREGDTANTEENTSQAESVPSEFLPFGPSSSSGKNDNDNKELKSIESNPDNATDIGDTHAVRHWTRHEGRYGFFSIFRYSGALDKVYMIVGLIAAIVGAIAVTMLIYIFGSMIRSMVLITRIEMALDCKEDKLELDSKGKPPPMLGNITTCKQFLDLCARDRPFKHKNFTRGTIKSLTKKTIMDFTLQFGLTNLVFMICCAIYFITWNLAGDNQIVQIRRKFFEALLRKDLTWFDTQLDRESLSSLMEFTKVMWTGMGENIPIAVNILFIAIFCVIMAFEIGWQLSSVGMIAVLVLISTISLVHWTTGRRMMLEMDSYREANASVEDTLRNIRTVNFYGGQKAEMLRYKQKLVRGRGRVMGWVVAQSLAIFLLWTGCFLMWAILFWFAVALIISSHNCKDHNDYAHYDSGDAIIIIFCTMFGVGNIYMIVPVVDAFREGKNHIRRIFKVIDKKSPIDSLDEEEGVIIVPEEFNGSIQFEDVRFTYPNSKTGDSVLNHLNLQIPAMSKTAVVGVSASGKSTIFKLLCKEYIADSGFVKIDGVDVRSLNTKWLRAQVGVVTQHADFFDDTIEANVRMGKLDAHFYEVQDACKFASAHSFIVSLKDGYQTRIGRSGVQLSPGEEQRIVLARALLRNPKILLVDEPTANLDPESEARVMETLNAIAQDRTVVLITHRLRAITGSDKIFVLKRGRVVEVGTHSTLIKNKFGPYFQLASGEFDQPSASFRPPYEESRSASGVLVIPYTQMVVSKLYIPNVYLDLISIDPVSVYCSKTMLEHSYRGINKGNYKGTGSTKESDDEYFTLGTKDSVDLRDKRLSGIEKTLIKTNSPAHIHDKKKEDPDLKIEPSVIPQIIPQEDVVEIRREEAMREKPTEAEKVGLKDVFNVSHLTFLRVLKLTTQGSYKAPIFISCICSIIVAGILATFGIVFSRTLGVMSDPSAIAGNWRWAEKFGEDNYFVLYIMGFVVMGLVAGGAAGLQDFMMTVASYNMVNYVRRKLFLAILKQDLGFFEDRRIKLKELLVTGVLSLRYLLDGFYANFLQSTLAVIVIVIIVAAVFPCFLVGYTVAIMVGMILINFTDGWLAKKQQLLTAEALEEMTVLMNQVFLNKEQVTIMQLEPFFLDKFKTLQMDALQKRRRISYIRAVTFPMSQTALFWAFTLYVFLTHHELTKKHNNLHFEETVAIGEILLFGTIVVGVNMAILPNFGIALRSGTKICDILERKPSLIGWTGHDFHGECKGDLEFRDVHFWNPSITYDIQFESPMLKGVTFNVDSGRSVAIVGGADSGKTAVIDVVSKLFDVTGGTILLDGQVLKGLNGISVRSLMGYVGDDAGLFSGRTIAENIAFGEGSHEIGMPAVIEVSERLNMHNLFISFPEGYHTRIGGSDDRLSAAQRLRVAIARAMLRNPKILLVDEPRVWLDREGEKGLYEGIDVARQGRTAIVIAHRLSKVKHYETIIVMDDGRISQMGTHEELLKNKAGVYARLWREQNPLEDDTFFTEKPTPKAIKPAPPPEQPPSLMPHRPSKTSLAKDIRNLSQAKKEPWFGGISKRQ